MVAAVTGVATLGVLVVWLVSVTRSLAALQHDVAELRREPVRLAQATERPSERVAASERRVRAGDVPVLVDAEGEALRDRPAPRLAAVAFSDPVIKAVALASGASKAVRSFRRTA